MKLTTSKPTPEQIKKLTAEQDRLRETFRILTANRDHLQRLETFVAEVRAEKDDRERKAREQANSLTKVVGSEYASNAAALIGLREQLQTLEPKLAQTQRGLERDIQIARSVVKSVCQDTIAAEFGKNLSDSFLDQFGELVRPFFAQIGFARESGKSTNSWSILGGYLQRHQPPISDFDSAETVINDIIAELGRILKGEVVVDVTANAAS